MVVFFSDTSDSSRAMVCRKMAQAYTNRNVKIRVHVFRENTQKIPILIVIFQRPVIKLSPIALSGPDTSADACVSGRFDVVYQPKIGKISKNF